MMKMISSACFKKGAFFSSCRLIVLFAFSLTFLYEGAAQTKKTVATTPHTADYYAAQWEQIDKLIDISYYDSAYTIASSLFAAAQKEDDSRAMLTAAYYLAVAERSYRDDANDSTLARYQALLPRLQPLERMVCHAFLADFYHDCLFKAQWRDYDDIASNEEDLDYKLWPAERYKQEIQRHLDSSLADTALLRSIDPSTLQPLLRKSKIGMAMPSQLLHITPTLYESMMLHAIECCDNTKQKEHYLNRLRAAHQASDEELRLYYDAEYVELRVSQPSYKRDTPFPAVTPAWVDSFITLYQQSTSPLLARLYLIKARAYYNGRWNHTLANPADYLKPAHDIAMQGYRLSPESTYGKECHRLALGIEEKSVSLHTQMEQPEHRPILAKADVRNVDTLYLRFVKHVPLEGWDKSKNKQTLATLPALQSWQQVVPQGIAYQSQNIYLVLPPMPAGNYYLLASSSHDFAPEQLAYCQLQCNDYLFAELPAPKDSNTYCLLNRTTGATLANATVEMQFVSEHDDEWRVDSLLTTVATDSNGLLTILDGELLRSTNRGKTIQLYAPQTKTTKIVTLGWSFERSYNGHPECDIFTDRPVYRAGEVVQYSLLFYHSDGLTQGQVLPGTTLKAALLDANRKMIDSLTLVTDSFGNAHGSFLLPANALPGEWSIRVSTLDSLKHRYYQYFPIEQYKQPKFSVVLHESHALYSFGTPAVIEGTAVAYTAMPIDGAKVEYEIDRCEAIPHRSYRDGWSRMRSEVIAFGDTVTDGTGAFAFSFVPLPDSTIDRGRNPIFEYHITVRVTDRNGESHEQQSKLRVGYVEGILAITTESEVRELKQLRYQYLNLNGAALNGTVQITIDELQQPQKPLLFTGNLVSANVTNNRHTVDAETFTKLFPHFAYSDTLLDAAYWPVRRTRCTLTHHADKEKPDNLVKLPDLPAGVYRISLRTTDVNGTAIETQRIITLTPENARKVQGVKLLWSDLNATSLQPGDTLLIRFGSRHENVTVQCFVTINSDSILYSQHLLNDNIETLCLPITEAMRGGVKVNLFAAKENTYNERVYHIDVPYCNKVLTLRWESFRDKLQSQRQETWTLRVLDSIGQRPAAANLLMTMYDAALDTYNTLNWGFFPWYTKDLPSTYRWIRYSTSGNFLFNKANSISIKPFHTFRWQLATRWPYVDIATDGDFVRGENGMMRAKGTSVESIVATVGGVGYGDAVVEMAEMEESYYISDSDPLPETNTTEGVSLRSNLSTLAFFEPSLRTDDSGRVSILFTVPDLLTQWHIEGLAYTKDLKVGSLIDKAITNKELMAVPNVPRFLRQGDEMDFAIKVSNASQTDQPVTVTFEMLDAATGKVLDIIMPRGTQSKENGMARQTIQLAARSSQEVVFNLHVPQGEFYAVTYRVVAHGETSSDGEQSVIPVLSNRTLVTESMSLYINGKGEKRYTLTHLKESQSNTLQNHSLTAEVTANPIWYAMQALPYVEDYENPSNLYLSSRLYANTLGSYLLQQNPQVEATFAAWRDNQPEALKSSLMQHEALTQVLLSETPWLRDGEGESARKQRIGNFFNNTTLQQNLAEAASKLRVNQMESGAWSWIAGSRYENNYVTAAILTDYGRLRHMVGKKALEKARLEEAMKRALTYIDKENYNHYLRCSKAKEDRTINIDYLYLRSFYTEKPKKKDYKSSHDYFYSNALRYHKEVENLYSMAQLAMVFYRHGDTKAAEKMVKRLKQRALTNNEQGMYWRDNVSGYLWHEHPIAVQSLLIEAFATVTPKDTESIARMQQWLLKQKQTTSWKSDIATVNAITALLAGKPSLGSEMAESVTMTVGGKALTTPKQAGTDYQQQRWQGDSITKEMADVTLTKATDGIAWGALYWQYFEEMDKVLHSEMGIKLQKKLYRVNKEGTLTLVDSTVTLKVGDKVRVQILIDCDRTMEYIELKDNRTAAFEPISTQSGWCWHDGLSYYTAVYDASSKFFIDRLQKGKYVLEYDLFVSASGERLSLGTTTIQCLYAPEFRATTPGTVIRVER